MRTLDRIEFYCFRNVVSRKSRRVSRPFLHSTLSAETYCDSALTIFIGDGEIICCRVKEGERFFGYSIFIEIGGVCGAFLHVCRSGEESKIIDRQLPVAFTVDIDALDKIWWFNECHRILLQSISRWLSELYYMARYHNTT